MFFREALRPPGADRQGALTPPDRPRYEKCPDRARVKYDSIENESLYRFHLNADRFFRVQFIWCCGHWEPTKILIYNIVPCHQMIQVYNSKAAGAEDVELATRVRSHVPNVILQIYSLGIATISGAPSARVCTRASEIVFRFLVYRYRTDHRYVLVVLIIHSSYPSTCPIRAHIPICISAPFRLTIP